VAISYRSQGVDWLGCRDEINVVLIRNLKVELSRFDLIAHSWGWMHLCDMTGGCIRLAR
jgi:hypothetical protein